MQVCTIFKNKYNKFNLNYFKTKMKKLVFMFICSMTMTFAACGNKTSNVATQNDTDTVAIDSVDTIAVDTVK